MKSVGKMTAGPTVMGSREGSVAVDGALFARKSISTLTNLPIPRFRRCTQVVIKLHIGPRFEEAIPGALSPLSMSAGGANE
jgi:hypothetical protein